MFARFGIPSQDAEDLLQQTLLTFLCKREEIRSPEAWLMGTLKKRCLMYWRRRRRSLCTAMDKAILEQVAADGTSIDDRTQLRHDLDSALRRLSSRCRSLLTLRYRHDCDFPEAARRMGYRASGIYKITQRCLAALTVEMVSCGLVEERGDA